jgi:hypothetical protein
MENEIPTAEEILQKHVPNRYTKENSWKNAMIEFAKLHVEAALNEASEDANMDSDYYQALQVYPLTNIK